MKVFNKYQISTLKRLVNYLKTEVPSEQFNMGTYHQIEGDDEVNGYPDQNECGTSACAFGWMVTMIMKTTNDPLQEFVNKWDNFDNDGINFAEVMVEIFEATMATDSNRGALLKYMFSFRWNNNINEAIERIESVIKHNQVTEEMKGHYYNTFRGRLC